MSTQASNFLDVHDGCAQDKARNPPVWTSVASEIKGLAPNLNPPVPNPAPLGLFAFGLTTALLQVHHTRLGGDTEDDAQGTTNLVWGFALFYGGLLQVIAGLGEVRRNNVLGYTAFLSYGGWWMSVGIAHIILILAPSDSDAAAAGFNPKATQAMLILWGMLTLVFWLCSFAVNVTINSLFFFLMMTFFLLAQGVSNDTVDKVAGWFGIVTSAIAFWLASAELINDVVGKGKVIIPLGDWDRIRQSLRKRAVQHESPQDEAQREAV